MIKNNIEIKLGLDIKHVDLENNHIISINTQNGKKIKCDKLIF